jgi:hypothetical protein
MSGRQLVATGIAVISLACASAPSQAGGYVSGYQAWLLSRQSGSGAALYNQPCSVSDGRTETVVPCWIAAAALNTPVVYPVVYDGGAVVIEAPRACGHRHARRHHVCQRY